MGDVTAYLERRNSVVLRFQAILIHEPIATVQMTIGADLSDLCG